MNVDQKSQATRKTMAMEIFKTNASKRYNLQGASELARGNHAQVIETSWISGFPEGPGDVAGCGELGNLIKVSCVMHGIMTKSAKNQIGHKGNKNHMPFEFKTPETIS